MRRLLNIVLLVFVACKQTSEIKQKTEEVNISSLDTIMIDSSFYKKEVRIDSTLFADLLYSKEDLEQFVDSSFVLLRKLDTTFLYSMKYASIDNFLKEKVFLIHFVFLGLKISLPFSSLPINFLSFSSKGAFSMCTVNLI